MSDAGSVVIPAARAFLLRVMACSTLMRISSWVCVDSDPVRALNHVLLSCRKSEVEPVRAPIGPHEGVSECQISSYRTRVGCVLSVLVR